MTTKIVPPFVRNPYNYDTMQASDDSALTCPEPTLTQQQFAEESDINYIADRYGLTGEMPQVLQMPTYGDFEGIFDFQSAQNVIIKARDAFLTLPAKIRTRFDNDPHKLIQFLQDPENRAEAEFLGLVTKKEPHEPGTAQAPDQGTQSQARAPRAESDTGKAKPAQEPGRQAGQDAPGRNPGA